MTDERAGSDIMAEQLRTLQEQLVRSEKMAAIGQLVAGVAHELNNPIGYVGSNLGMLQRYVTDIEPLLDALLAARAAVPAGAAAWPMPVAVVARMDLEGLRRDLRELVEESIEGVTRVQRIVKDLKDFSRGGAEQWEWADLHRGLDSTLNIVNNEIKYKATVVKCYGELPQIECLPSQLNQVFMNLLVNAAHAIAESGTITIASGSDGDDRVWIEISDTGCGIAPEHLPHIYEPFFTTKPVGKGTGLGLALTRDIVHRHRGDITASSEPGRGTSFRISLPVRRPDEEEMSCE